LAWRLLGWQFLVWKKQFLVWKNMNRLAIALISYLVLGALAYTTLSDPRIKAGTLLILGLFAFKSWMRRKDVLHPDGDSDSE
jgi:hypothetical protein